jgi:hypothetical protein
MIEDRQSAVGRALINSRAFSSTGIELRTFLKQTCEHGGIDVPEVPGVDGNDCPGRSTRFGIPAYMIANLEHPAILLIPRFCSRRSLTQLRSSSMGIFNGTAAYALSGRMGPTFTLPQVRALRQLQLSATGK